MKFTQRSKTTKKVIFWLVTFFLLILIILGTVVFSSKSKPNQPQNQTIKPLKTLTIEPTQKHTATLIFLHGLGDKAENWEEILRPLAENYPHFKFIIPQAPWISVSMNYGIPMPAWYNIKGNIKDTLNLKQDKKGLLKSVSQIENIIQSEIDFRIEKIMVGGFSQGGSVALAIGLTTRKKLNKIICLSGFLPCREEIFSWSEKKNTSLPFHFYHNVDDDMVTFEVGKKSSQMIKEQGFLVNFREKDSWRGHIWPWEEIVIVMKRELEN
ncbi:MAG: hypothetical protein MRERC_5c058 [Mycoplasmataceae bacterium RC_NB112A]|nr:MAG: hypothetical protein MRERC_5c058 [Mycoplasmataceae bacterium RC_NB112A]